MKFKLNTNGFNIGISGRLRWDTKAEAESYLEAVVKRFETMIKLSKEKDMKFGKRAVGDLLAELDRIKLWTVEEE